jgi:hypothetical protein
MSQVIEIDIDDYVSDSDKATIARDAFRSACTRRAEKDFERILSNASYAIAWNEVNDAFDGDMAKTVAEKTKSVIRSIGRYDVFHPPSAWDAEKSKGWVALQEATEKYRTQLEARILSIIEGLDEEWLKTIIQDHIATTIIGKLTTKETKS